MLVVLGGGSKRQDVSQQHSDWSQGGTAKHDSRKIRAGREASRSAAGNSLPPLRLRSLPSRLHPASLGRKACAPPRMPAMWPTNHHMGTSNWGRVSVIRAVLRGNETISRTSPLALLESTYRPCPTTGAYPIGPRSAQQVTPIGREPL